VGGGAHYRSERRCEYVVELQVRNKEGYLRWLPRRLCEGRIGTRSDPVFVIALYRKLKVEAKIEIVSQRYPDPRPGRTHSSTCTAHERPSPELQNRSSATSTLWNRVSNPARQQDRITAQPEGTLPELISRRQRLPVYSLSMNPNCLRKSDTNPKDGPTRLRPTRTHQEHRIQLSAGPVRGFARSGDDWRRTQ